MENIMELFKCSYGLLMRLLSSSGHYAIGGTVLFCLLIHEAYKTDIPKVPRIISLGGAYPFVGHLPLLGGRLKKNDATLFTEWGRKLGTDIFQIKLGEQRVVVVNSWAKMKDFWTTRNSMILDRPIHHEFLDFVGIDISGSSWTEQLRRCRAAGVKALGKPMWPSYYHLMEPNADDLIRHLLEEGGNGKVPLDLFPWLRQMVIDLTLYLTYGARAGDFDNELTNTLLQAIADVSSVRGSTASYRQYVSLLRLKPLVKSKVIDAVARRGKCIDKLYDQYLEKVAKGEGPQCIVSSLSADKLTLEEIHGTCISLLQAAPGTVASTLYQCLAWLCVPENQSFQKEAVNAILEAYDGDRNKAWEMAFREEKVHLLVSLYKETLRFYAISPYSGRRLNQSVEDLYGTRFPKGLEMMLNIQAVNHDREHYGPDAETFVPSRFLDDATPLPHLSYGTGSRMCPAYQISNRIIYAMLLRMLLAFEIKQVDGPEMRLPSIDMIDFSDNYGLVARPRNYDSIFVARDHKWLKERLSS